MPERRKPVNMQTVYYLCDNCKIGSLRESGKGICLLTQPPQYRHTCTNCRSEYTLNKLYPYVEYTDA